MGSNKLDCYITLGWKGLVRTNTLAYMDQFIIYKENEVLWMVSNKLDCYITLGWKSLPRTNTLAYWAIHKLQRKWTVVKGVQ